MEEVRSVTSTPWVCIEKNRLTMPSDTSSASSDMQDTDVVGPVDVGSRLSDPKDQRLLPESDGNASGRFPSSISCAQRPSETNDTKGTIGQLKSRGILSRSP